MILKNYQIQNREEGRVIYQRFQMKHKKTNEIRDMQIQKYVKGNLIKFIEELKKKAIEEFNERFANEYDII